MVISAGRVGIVPLLGPTFTSKLRQEVFDTLALVTPEGGVILATGRRQQELQSTPLDAVLTPKELEGGKNFQQLSRTISVKDAVIAGVPYKLFIQPCCGSVSVQVAGKPGDAGRDGMIIAGLIESDALHGAALAISPDLVIGGVVLTLMALVIWPFLKLTFLGERQRVTLWDLVQLGGCSIFGLALGAIIIITADVYTRLNADVDEQLEGLAHELGTHIAREVGFAYRQLTALERQLRGQGRGTIANVSVAGGGYPDYETFALIDQNGSQQVKSGPLDWVPGLISVRERMYFEVVRDKRYWRGLAPCTPAWDDGAVLPAWRRTPDSSGGCFLESLWSWTTGQRQAVLSKATGDPALPVAALGIPMRSLMNPVLPPGFEYAVIDNSGAVLFHSDSQRNTHEDLFIETDRDRRLRAMIAGHSSGAFSTMYWGRPYRAHIEAAAIPNWSIVTLFDKQGTRGLVLEWTAVSLLLLSVYLIAWLLVMLFALKIGVSWLWPDVRRSSRYVILIAFYCVLFVIFATAAFAGDSNRLLYAALGISVLTWSVAFAVLWKRPAADQGKREDQAKKDWITRYAALEYAIAGALFFVLSGVVPGVAFVVRSYDMHIESYVKHRQLGLARALAVASGGAARIDDNRGAAAGPELSALNRYYSFFYGTSVSERDRSIDPGQLSGGHHDLFLSMLEDHLPYYTESSVEMRELLHDRAGDETWISRRTDDGQLELRVAQDTPGKELVVSSMLPAPVPFWSSAAHAAGAEHAKRPLVLPYLAPLLIASLAAFACAIVAFLLRHVFLASVYKPLWANGQSSGQLVTTAGDNVLVLCEDPLEMAGTIPDVSKLALGPIVRDENSAAAWTRARTRISSGGAGRAVVITDLDKEFEDVNLMYAKIELLQELVYDPERTVVVLVQNPAMLQGSVRPGQHLPDRALWVRLLKTFVVLDWRGKPAEDDRQRLDLRRWFLQAVRSGFNDPSNVLDREGQTDPFVRHVCEDIRGSKAYEDGLLSREQVLDEIAERTSSYYRRLWDNCSDDERVVLAHVAQYGLTNAASRRVVRRLLVRRLLTKDPDLRVMNLTFRRFVLSPVNMRQVAQLEGLAEPSTWDRLRVPFALAAVGAGVFLFTTQRDMFNETMTGLAAVAAAVPMVLRAVSVIAQRDLGAPPPSSNA